MGIHVGERHALQAVEGLAAQLEGGVVGEAVRHEGERILGCGGAADDERHELQHMGEREEIDLSRSHDAVDGLARERGEGERAHGDHDDEHEERGEHLVPAREEPEHAADGLVLIGPGGRRVHRLTSSLVSCDSQISR